MQQRNEFIKIHNPPLKGILSVRVFSTADNRTLTQQSVIHIIRSLKVS